MIALLPHHREPAGLARTPASAPGAALLLTLVLAGCAAEPERPNVLIVVVDTLRADHLAAYGYERPTDGALAGFFGSATRFTEAYAPSAWTRPSVATLFTGLVPARHRAKIDGTNRLNPAALTLAEVLADAGWQTAGVSFNVEITRQTLFDQGFETFVDYQGGVLAYPDVSLMAEAASNWIAGAHGPFFLYLQPMNVHGPYKVPPPSRTSLLGRPPSREFSYRSPPLTAIMAGALEWRERVGPSYLSSLTDQYDTAIRYSMDSLGRILERLRELGRYDDTLIVVTSDHGEELYDHGGFSHAYSLYQEVVRVPLFIKLPQQNVGSVVEARVSLADLYPTVLAALDLPLERRVDGASLLPLLRSPGRAGGEERELIFELNNRERCAARGLLAGRYKLVHVETSYEGVEDRLLLFDLADDPGEQRDLAGELPEVAERMHARMIELFDRYEAEALPLPGGPEAEIDEETLRALGYL